MVVGSMSDCAQESSAILGSMHGLLEDSNSKSGQSKHGGGKSGQSVDEAVGSPVEGADEVAI